MCLASSCSCCWRSRRFSALSSSFLWASGGNRKAFTASLCVFRQNAIREWNACWGSWNHYQRLKSMRHVLINKIQPTRRLKHNFPHRCLPFACTFQESKKGITTRFSEKILWMSHLLGEKVVSFDCNKTYPSQLKSHTCVEYMSPVSFDCIQPLEWSTLASMPPSRMALVTILSASSTAVAESKCSFCATSAKEIREYEILIFRRPVLITLCRNRTIRFWLLSVANTVAFLSATDLNSSKSPIRTACQYGTHKLNIRNLIISAKTQVIKFLFLLNLLHTIIISWSGASWKR